LSDSVIILGPAHPFRGGIAASNERLAIEFQKLDWKTKIYSYTIQYPKLLFPGQNQFTDDPPPENIEIQRTFSTINPFSWRKLTRQIKKENPNLVISRYWLPYTALSTSYIHRRLTAESQVQSVSIVDNLIPHQKLPGDQRIQEYFLSSLDKFFALSESVKLNLEKKVDSSKVSYSPHPIYDHYGDIMQKKEACKTLELDPAFRYMLFFGFIKAYKGLDLLLESLEKEYLKKNQIKLIIAGDVYGNDSIYKDIIIKKQLEEHIIFHKRYIPKDIVKAYFSVCELVVQTYHTATQSGITQIALHFEKPILVTDVGGLSEFVIPDETGYIIPKQTHMIMQTIRQHFNKVDLSKMALKLRQEKSKYQWKPFTEQLIKFANS